MYMCIYIYIKYMIYVPTYNIYTLMAGGWFYRMDIHTHRHVSIYLSTYIYIYIYAVLHISVYVHIFFKRHTKHYYSSYCHS